MSPPRNANSTARASGHRGHRRRALRRRQRNVGLRAAAIPHRQHAVQSGRRVEAFREPQPEREAAIPDRKQLSGVIDDLARTCPG